MPPHEAACEFWDALMAIILQTYHSSFLNGRYVYAGMLIWGLIYPHFCVYLRGNHKVRAAASC